MVLVWCSDNSSYIFFGGIVHVARRSGDLTATFVDPFTRERNFPFKKKAFVLHMLQ